MADLSEKGGSDDGSGSGAGTAPPDYTVRRTGFMGFYHRPETQVGRVLLRSFFSFLTFGFSRLRCLDWFVSCAQVCYKLQASLQMLTRPSLQVCSTHCPVSAVVVNSIKALVRILSQRPPQF